MNIYKSLIILSLLFLIISISSCEDPEIPIIEDDLMSIENVELLDQIINEILDDNPIPGIVVGVKSTELGTYKKAFGYSNLVNETPMNVDAVFGIGSVHKNFKWILLHLLAQDSTIFLDDLVNTHLEKPDLPGVTLRHLTYHSSGLCDIADVSAFNEDVWNNPTMEYSYETMMNYLENASGMNSYGPFVNGRLENFEVGENSSYSSFGPLILAEVLLKITGKNIRELIDERILDNLDLASTSHMAYEADPTKLTIGYADSVTISPFTPTASSTMGLSSANGGAMHSTVTDLLKYVHAQFTDEEFLNSQSIANLTSDYLQAPGMKIGQGVIQFNQWEHSDFWGHAGFGIRSHSTTILHNIDKELSIVVLTNIYTPRDNFQTNIEISDAIIEALY